MWRRRVSQFEHERHLKAINEAADQLERLAEGSRGGRVSRNAVRASAAAARSARAEAGQQRLRSRAARACARAGTRQARPVRQPRARPLGGAPLRPLPLLSGVGRGDRGGHLLHGGHEGNGHGPQANGRNGSAAAAADGSPGRAPLRMAACSGRGCGSATACARCRRAACVSWTSPSPIPRRSAPSGS